VFRLRSAGRGETILLVEDDRDQRWLIQHFLEVAGYRVLGAKDGEEAVDIHRLHSHQIVLATLDLGLPKLNGWEAFHRMKQLTPDLKAILTTGYLSHSIQSYSREFSAVIAKPFMPEDLLAKIATILGRGRPLQPGQTSFRPTAGYCPGPLRSARPRH
jgi:CheY-like chemotaxis protein